MMGVSDADTIKKLKAEIERINNIINQTRYFLGQDESSHWYLVLEDRVADWSKWLSLASDDPESWETPKCAIRLDGSPGSVSFTDPSLRGEAIKV